jgi:hypothetical protein
MTQDEIIELAKQSDLGFLLGDSWLMHHEIEYFAKLVAEKVNADWSETNERLIKVFNEKADLAYLSGAKEEREACAKVCDDLDKSHWGCEVKASWCSEAIRARGQA